MVWNKAKELICKLALAYLDQLCVPWRHQKLQCRASVDSRVLSSSVYVASHCRGGSRIYGRGVLRVFNWASGSEPT